MRKFVLLLVWAYPLISLAQRNDIYFIPKKESKVIVVETDADKVILLNDEEVYSEEEYYSDDSYAYDNDDFRYSTRIVRFRNPYSCMGSPLYWDLMFNNGFDDWVLYDNGYYVDIYPTYNNWWGWNSWYYPTCYTPWGYHRHYPSYHWNAPHHIHGGYHPPYIAHNSWRPAHKVHTNIPVRKAVRNVKAVPSNVKRENNTVRAKRGDRVAVNRPNVQTSKVARPSVAGERVNRVSNNNNARVTTVNRQQPQRTTGNSSVRTQQPRRTSTSSAVSKSENTKSSDAKTRNSNERTTRSSSSSSSSRSSYRSSSYSSGEYNRPSSTSVSRQRSSSSSSGSMSGGVRSHSNVRSGSRR